MDIVKLDKGFVDIIYSEQGRILVSSTITMLKNLNIHTVAEGIETETQAKILRSFHCDVGQGYFFARPAPLEELFDLSATESPSSQEGCR